MEINDAFELAVIDIIKAQEEVIGPLALEQANKVKGLKVDWPSKKVTFSGDKTVALQTLIEKYHDLFGQISVEVCRDSVANIIRSIPAEQLPSLLK